MRASKTIQFEVTKENLHFWDEKTKNWKFRNGKYEFMLGASSDDLRLHKTFDY